MGLFGLWTGMVIDFFHIVGSLPSDQHLLKINETKSIIWGGKCLIMIYEIVYKPTDAFLEGKARI